MTMAQKQALFAYLGYYDGPIDGLDGANTRDAAKAFQRAEGLTVDDLEAIRVALNVE